jgi:hypothetical protein
MVEAYGSFETDIPYMNDTTSGLENKIPHDHSSPSTPQFYFDTEARKKSMKLRLRRRTRELQIQKQNKPAN